VDVLLDRGEDGFGVLEALRELDASLVAVMMSGLDKSQFETRAYQSGAVGILQKTDMALARRDAVVRAYIAATG
jgi:DNA-binding response OmpR family regulator